MGHLGLAGHFSGIGQTVHFADLKNKNLHLISDKIMDLVAGEFKTLYTRWYLRQYYDLVGSSGHFGLVLTRFISGPGTGL